MHRKGAAHRIAPKLTRRERVAANNRAAALGKLPDAQARVDSLTEAYNSAVSRRRPRQEIDGIGRQLKKANAVLKLLERYT